MCWACVYNKYLLCLYNCSESRFNLKNASINIAAEDRQKAMYTDYCFFLGNTAIVLLEINWVFALTTTKLRKDIHQLRSCWFWGAPTFGMDPKLAPPMAWRCCQKMSQHSSICQCRAQGSVWKTVGRAITCWAKMKWNTRKRKRVCNSRQGHKWVKWNHLYRKTSAQKRWNHLEK